MSTFRAARAAIKAGNPAQFKTIFAAMSDTEKTALADVNGKTLLEEACASKRSLSFLEVLLCNGFGTVLSRTSGTYGETLLHKVVLETNWLAADFLLTKQAKTGNIEVNGRTHDRYTALQLISSDAISGHLLTPRREQVIRVLLRHGADLMCRCESMRHAGKLACDLTSDEVLRELLQPVLPSSGALAVAATATTSSPSSVLSNARGQTTNEAYHATSSNNNINNNRISNGLGSILSKFLSSNTAGSNPRPMRRCCPPNMQLTLMPISEGQKGEWKELREMYYTPTPPATPEAMAGDPEGPFFRIVGRAAALVAVPEEVGTAAVPAVPVSVPEPAPEVVVIPVPVEMPAVPAEVAGVPLSKVSSWTRWCVYFAFLFSFVVLSAFVCTLGVAHIQYSARTVSQWTSVVPSVSSSSLSLPPPSSSSLWSSAAFCTGMASYGNGVASLKGGNLLMCGLALPEEEVTPVTDQLQAGKDGQTQVQRQRRGGSFERRLKAAGGSFGKRLRTAKAKVAAWSSRLEKSHEAMKRDVNKDLGEMYWMD